MGSSTEALTQEIRRARSDLASTLEVVGDRLAPKKVMARAKTDVAGRVEDVRDRVSPKRVWERRTETLRLAVRDVQVSIMGTTGRDDEMSSDNQFEQRRLPKARGTAQGASQRLVDQTGEVAGTVADRAQRAPSALRDKAEGNPLVAGVIAFGGGVLLASLLAPTDPERKVAQRVKEKAQPLKDEAIQAGRSVVGEVHQVAQDSGEQVKQRASDAAQQVKQQAKASTQHTTGHAKEAATQVQREAKTASTRVKAEAKPTASPTKAKAKAKARQ